MKKRTVIVVTLLVFQFGIAQNGEFPKEKQEALKEVFERYIEMGIPGLGLTVYSTGTGHWSYAEGLANLEEEKPLTTDHRYFLQSVSKTYMAVVILKLYEKGKLALEDPIVKYLDYPWLNSIEGVEKITIKNLLNHTSGLPEYSTDPLLVSDILHDPLNVLTVVKLLSYIDGKEMEFDPGSKYRYRNTNYALLSLVADAITGDHTAYMNKVIFKKLKLRSTFYLTKTNHLDELELVDAYWDVLMEELPANISKIQRANVASMRGDDGLVSSTEDAVAFLKGLVEGKLLKPKTLELMQDWVTDEEGRKRYGLGVTYYDLDITYGIGHSGGGLGAGCVLIYLPELEAVLFLGTNFNTLIESPLRKRAENLQMDVLTALFVEGPQP